MKTMNSVLQHNESLYDILLKNCIASSEITSNVFKLIATAGFIAVISYIFYCIHDYRYKRTSKSKYNLLELQKYKNYNRLFIRHRSVISHKDMLHALEDAADKCDQKFYALRCIDIVVYCPQLVNVKSSPYGITPFHRVCFQGHKCLIAFMLAKGADPFLTTVTGENALCMVVYYILNNPAQNDFSCLKMLIQTGCRFGIRDNYYKKLLELAFKNNHTKLVQWLIIHYKVPSHKTLRCSSTPPM